MKDRHRQHPAGVPQRHEPAGARRAPVSAAERSREVPVVVTVNVTQRDVPPSPERSTRRGRRSPCALPPGAATARRAAPRPRARAAARHRSLRHVGGLRSGCHQHDVLGRDRDRGPDAGAFDIEPVDGEAVGRRREADVPTKAPVRNFTPRARSHAANGSMNA